VEDERYSREYHDSDKRSIANAVQIHFSDGNSSEKVEVEYPIGHRRRRAEGIPVLEAKFKDCLATRFPPKQVKAIMTLCLDQKRLEKTTVNDFMGMFVI
jgi:2-methylcitrate dehydratase PrpD